MLLDDDLLEQILKELKDINYLLRKIKDVIGA